MNSVQCSFMPLKGARFYRQVEAPYPDRISLPGFETFVVQWMGLPTPVYVEWTQAHLDAAVRERRKRP